MNVYLPILLAKHEGTFWFAPEASTFAEETDSLFMIILWISAAFFVPLVIAMVWFAIKFRRRPGYEGDSSALHNNALEITWSVIPTLIVCWIFVRGVDGYMDMVTPPPNTIDINVTARKWSWTFTYPNGAVSTELHVPKGRDVRLLMRSEDVLHAFFVPAFRTKQDVVPGRLNTIWFHPTREGTYDLFCAEYCGEKHSEMLSHAFVHSEEEYDKKLVELNKRPEGLVAYGLWLLPRKGCSACHSIEPDKILVGPSFAGSWGKEFKTAAGETVHFDEKYVEESIRNPAAKRRADFNPSATMSNQGEIKPEEMIALQALIKALADGVLTDEELNAVPPPMEPSGTETKDKPTA